MLPPGAVSGNPPPPRGRKASLLSRHDSNDAFLPRRRGAPYGTRTISPTDGTPRSSTTTSM
ncbi:hypothetical protein Acsp07_59240 [Actinomycetospora sp. NBRC 106378]|nr:hypothetical protein Acsp07_59240 [Actinomycetospora sp. NBRC 106378]